MPESAEILKEHDEGFANGPCMLLNSLHGIDIAELNSVAHQKRT